MTVHEMYNSIDTMCQKDPEMKEIYEYIYGGLNWELVQTFNTMILLQELKKRMQDEVVCFTFNKTDGSSRQAFGTRDREVIGNHSAQPKGKQTNRQFSGTFPYFDIEKQAWRSFKVEKIVDINRGYSL